VGKRVIDMDRWRRRRLRRLDAPAKGHIYASTDELLAERLRQVRLPEPPPGLRQRSRRTYDDWLNADANRNRWRDGG
jgi:hypothetical protein